MTRGESSTHPSSTSAPASAAFSTRTERGLYFSPLSLEAGPSPLPHLQVVGLVIQELQSPTAEPQHQRSEKQLPAPPPPALSIEAMFPGRRRIDRQGLSPLETADLRREGILRRQSGKTTSSKHRSARSQKSGISFSRWLGYGTPSTDGDSAGGGNKAGPLSIHPTRSVHSTTNQSTRRRSSESAFSIHSSSAQAPLISDVRLLPPPSSFSLSRSGVSKTRLTISSTLRIKSHPSALQLPSALTPGTRRAPPIAANEDSVRSSFLDLFSSSADVLPPPNPSRFASHDRSSASSFPVSVDSRSSSTGWTDEQQNQRSAPASSAPPASPPEHQLHLPPSSLSFTFSPAELSTDSPAGSAHRSSFLAVSPPPLITQSSPRSLH